MDYRHADNPVPFTSYPKDRLVAKSEPEEIAARFEGGPNPGTFVIKGAWPLPEELGHFEADGFYKKISESGLPSDVVNGAPHLIRGVQYQWQPNWVQDGGSEGQEGKAGHPGHG